MRMLGNPEVFALEFSLDNPARGYGRACFWCAGQPLGALDGGVYFDGYVGSFLQALLRLPALPSALQAMSLSQADAALLHMFSASEQNAEDLAAETLYTRAQRHLLSCGDLLDDWEVVGWRDDSGRICLAWQPPRSRSRQQAVLPQGAVAGVATALREVLARAVG